MALETLSLASLHTVYHAFFKMLSSRIWAVVNAAIGKFFFLSSFSLKIYLYCWEQVSFDHS